LQREFKLAVRFLPCPSTAFYNFYLVLFCAPHCASLIKSNFPPFTAVGAQHHPLISPGEFYRVKMANVSSEGGGNRKGNGWKGKNKMMAAILH